MITKRTVKMHRYDEREIEIYRERERDRDRQIDMAVWGRERLRDGERRPGRVRPHCACLGEAGPDIL